MKNTKKALLLSVMSLVLCLSMLVGTTFAWFTDSVSTGNNIIASGNLDIELEYSKDFQKWTPVDENTNVFDTTLWEPGHTEVVYLHITNEGSLALKYQLGVNIVSETTGINVDGKEFKLSDHIVYGVKEDVGEFADRAEARKDLEAQKLNELYNSKVTTLTPKDDTVTTDEKIVALVVYMPEEVGNVANHKTGTTAPQINLGIELNATQVEAEEDSFDNTYDEGAFLANIYTAAELRSALNQGGKFNLAADIADTESFNIPEGVEVTLYLGEHTISGSMHKNDGHVIDNDGVLNLIGGSVASTADNGGSAIRNDGTLNVEGTSITGAPKAGSSWPSYAINNYGDMNLSDVTVTSNHGAISCQGGETVLENVDVTMNGIGGSSHVFYIGGNGTKVTVNGGNYIHKGNVDGSLAYIMAGSEMIINDGYFTASNGGYGLAAYNGSLVVNGGTFDNAFLNWGGPIAVYGGTFAKDPSAFVAAGYKATAVDGLYYVTEDTTTVTNDSATLKTAAKTKGATIILTPGTYAAPDLAEGVTIIGGEGVAFNTTLSGTMKNVTIKDVAIKAANAQRWAYAYGTVVFEGCTFESTGVYAIHYDQTTGADILYKDCTIIGWAALGSGANSLTFDGCTIKGNGTYGVIRSYSDVTVKNCTFDVADVNPTDPYQDGLHAVDCVMTVENCVNVNGTMEEICHKNAAATVIIK